MPPRTGNMRILFLLTFYTPHWTGLTAYARRIAEGLARRGHTVSCLTTQHDPDLPLQEEINGVMVYRVPTNIQVSRSPISLKLLPKLNELLEETDVVSIHIPFPEVMLATALARKAGASVFITHNGDLILPKGPLKRPLEMLYYQMTGAAGRMSTAVIPQTRDYAQSSNLLRPLGEKGKLEFIYAPVDQPPPDADNIAAWRKELGLEDKFLVGFAGRFVEEKGFDFLFEAVPEIVAARPDTHFVFAGEHEISYEGFFDQHREVIEAHSEYFTMLGLITDDQKMADFYGMIDIFALPSRSDCFPSTQIESVRAGTPLVTADIPGAREIVKVTGMGQIVAARDPHALAQGILEVAENIETYRGKHDDALAIFDPEKCFEEYEALFERSLGREGESSEDVGPEDALASGEAEVVEAPADAPVEGSLEETGPSEAPADAVAETTADPSAPETGTEPEPEQD